MTMYVPCTRTSCLCCAKC